MSRSLQSKITLGMGLLVAVSMTIAVIVSGHLMVKSHRDSVKQQLQSTAATLLSLGISDFAELRDFEQLDHFIENALRIEKIDKIIRVYDKSKNIIFTTATAYDTLPKKLEANVKHPLYLTVSGTKTKYESLVIPYVSKKKQFYLQVAIPLPKYSEILQAFWFNSAFLLITLIIVCVLFSHGIVRWLLGPVQKIAEFLKGLDPEKIETTKPLESKKGEYLSPITSGINLLIEKTRLTLRQMRKMSRYVAHELRTPLTILQGEAETVLLNKSAHKEDYQKVLHSSLEEIQRMSDSISAILEISNKDLAVKSFKSESFDLAPWMESNKIKWEKSLGRPLHFEYSGEKLFVVFLDPKLLFHLIDNLIRNVREHAGEEAVCHLKLETAAAGAQLLVIDNGKGLPFTLIDTLNRSTGLFDMEHIGLGLCRRIADILNIGLNFANRQDGGLQVSLSFVARGFLRTNLTQNLEALH